MLIKRREHGSPYGRVLGIGLMRDLRTSHARCAEKRITTASSSSLMTSFVTNKVTTGSSVGHGPQLVDVLLRMLLWSRRDSGLAEEGWVFMETKSLQNTRAARTRFARTFLHASVRWCLSAASSRNRLRGSCG